MKRSAFVRQKKAEKEQEMTSAAMVYRVALADLLKAKPDEEFHAALLRQIDERVAYNRWYRKVWRWLLTFPLQLRDLTEER